MYDKLPSYMLGIYYALSKVNIIVNCKSSYKLWQ